MNILAIGSHPDDIEYGCAGTLLKFIRAGHTVSLFVASRGQKGGDPKKRYEEQMHVALSLGTRNVFWGNCKDTELSANKELIDRISFLIDEQEIDMVFVHYPDDTHQDHRALAEATISSTRYKQNILFYEGPTTKNFLPTIYMNIEDCLDEKVGLFKLYKSQTSKMYNPDIKYITIMENLLSCANFRGIQGRIKHAEAFFPLRMMMEIPDTT